MTDATNKSPLAADGNLLRRPCTPFTAITNKFFAPVLSAQFITAPTGNPRATRNLPPTLPPAKRANNWYFKYYTDEIKKSDNNILIRYFILYEIIEKGIDLSKIFKDF